MERSISKMNNVETMYAMLHYKRPHRKDRRFIRDFITNLRESTYDKFGNRMIRIGDAPIMYSCHTDSAHKDAGYQRVVVNKSIFKLSKHSKSDCLGADNAAGVWIMREMIQANKPGLYVFHRGEEVGCLGSKHIVQNTPELVKGIQACVAFDRRKTHSVITHMWKGRTCSDAFGNSLAKELGLGHKLDDGGSITDSGQYTDLIAECTNVSVGFEHEHTQRETLDMSYLMELRASMLALDWQKLVIARKPGEYEPKKYTWSGWTPESSNWGEYEKFRHPEYKKYKHYYDNGVKRIGFIPKQGDLLADGHEMVGSDMYQAYDEIKANRLAMQKSKDRMYMGLMIRNNPLLVADLLDDFGQSVDDVADHIFAHGGFLPAEMYGYDKYKDR